MSAQPVARPDLECGNTFPHVPLVLWHRAGGPGLTVGWAVRVALFV